VFDDSAARNESRVRKKKLCGIRRRSQSLSTLSHRSLNVTLRIAFQFLRLKSLAPPVGTENLIRIYQVTESAKLAR
jgi:hypothetical protein